MDRIPEDFKDSKEVIMTNFDHTIEKDVANKIKGQKLYAQYSGWNFCGDVWWAGKDWACEIWQYGSYINTLKADTLDELMEEVSNYYGAD